MLLLHEWTSMLQTKDAGKYPQVTPRSAIAKERTNQLAVVCNLLLFTMMKIIQVFPRKPKRVINQPTTQNQWRAILILTSKVWFLRRFHHNASEMNKYLRFPSKLLHLWVKIVIKCEDRIFLSPFLNGSLSRRYYLRKFLPISLRNLLKAYK